MNSEKNNQFQQPFCAFSNNLLNAYSSCSHLTFPSVFPSYSVCFFFVLFSGKGTIGSPSVEGLRVGRKRSLARLTFHLAAGINVANWATITFSRRCHSALEARGLAFLDTCVGGVLLCVCEPARVHVHVLPSPLLSRQQNPEPYLRSHHSLKSAPCRIHVWCKGGRRKECH